MLITAVCPCCATRYRVQADLRGRSMLCPKPTCRAVFVVRDEAPAPASHLEPPPVRAPRPGPQQTGSVGDLVPILPAQPAPPNPRQPSERGSNHVSDLLPLVDAAPAAPVDLPLEPQQSSWLEPPPVRQPPNSTPPPAKPAPPPPRPTARRRPPSDSTATPLPKAPPPAPAAPPPAEHAPSGPQVLGPQEWDLPPVRGRGAGGPATAPAPGPVGQEPPHTEAEHGHDAEVHAHEVTPPRHLRWTKWGVVGLVVAVVGILGGGWWLVGILTGQTEQEMAGLAKRDYDAGNYRAAEELYRQIPTKFPDSENVEQYNFLADLSALRARTTDKADNAPLNTLEAIEEFVKARPPKDPLLHESSSQVGEALVKFLIDFSDKASTDPTDDSPKEIDRAERTIKVVQGIHKGKVISKADQGRIAEAFDKVRVAVAKMQGRRAVLAYLKKLSGNPSFPTIQEAKRLVREKERSLPGLAGDPEVKQLIARLYEAHQSSVRYVEEPAPSARAGSAVEDEPGILFAPQVIPGRVATAEGDPVVLALDRGVLYALRQSSGQVKWAVRVGIDTTALPVRVPATAGSPERILVLSSDTARLTAYDDDGHPLWRYRLNKPCLGRPVVVDHYAYLPTVDGQVHEIELAGGLRRGRYLLGQRLTLGGTREPATSRVYFPAADNCVYVLDVARRKCETVLYSGHPSGSLRSEALVVAPGRRGIGPSYLILNQTEGLHRVRLRVFDLPLRDPHARARPLPQAALAGWTWFAPHLDPEKLVLASDAGALGLFGIRQARNADTDLFPWLPGGGLDVTPYLKDEGGAPDSRRHRAEVVQVAGDDLWVLAAGRLQRLRLAWGQGVGPEVVRGWSGALDLGAPLHASQVVEEPGTGRSTLFLVTRPLRRATCWVTAVEGETGAVRWRRELGLVCHGEPLAVPAAKGPPLLLALDQAGGLFSLDSTRFHSRPGVPWQSDSARVRLAGSLEGNPDNPPTLVPAADGKSAYALACPGGGNELVVRHVKPAPKGRGLDVEESKVRLPAPLAGTPALMGDWLMCPLATETGTFARVPLAGGVVQEGGDWRNPRAEPRARGHLLALGDDRFLTTDGLTGLGCWVWPNDRKSSWSILPAGRDSATPTLELKDPIVGAPLRLPDKPGGLVRLCVADAGGTLSLVEVRADGGLEVRRTWDLRGRVTGGLFLRTLPGGALRVGCVVKESQVLWIVPERAGVAWTFQSPSHSAIVGQPQLVEDLLVVADQSGLYLGLDPATGKPVGPGYQLRGSIAPATGPVAFGPGRLLAPLSDGTALLLGLGLGLRRVHSPLRNFPTAW